MFYGLKLNSGNPKHTSFRTKQQENKKQRKNELHQPIVHVKRTKQSPHLNDLETKNRTERHQRRTSEC